MHLFDDKSAFVRRELAIPFREDSLKIGVNAVTYLASSYDGQDRWYLETLGAAMDGSDSVRSAWYNKLKKLGSDTSIGLSNEWRKLDWEKRLTSFCLAASPNKCHKRYPCMD
jgi:hypothetical protein